MEGAQKSSSKIGMWGLIILIATGWVLNTILPAFLPGFSADEQSFYNYLPIIITALVAFVIGILIGQRIPVQKEAIKTSIGVGLFTLLFFHFVMIPSNSIGLKSVVMYSLFLIVPTLIGSFIGHSMKK